jgi:flap endonuclease-1
MGIKFKDLFYDYREPLNLKVDLKGQKLGIDAYIMIYQMLSAIRRMEEGGTEFSYEGHVTSHLLGIFRRSLFMLENGTKPVAVFDGPPIDFKALTLEKRAEIKKEAQQKYEMAMEAGDLSRAAVFAQATVKITDEILDDTKRLLELLGIPHITAAHDAEAQLALMTKKGFLSAAASQDYDTFVFGSPRVVRNLTISQQRRRGGKIVKIVPEQFYLKKILAGLEINHKKLIYAGLLIGTDFNDGVKGIGPKTALKIVKQYDKFDEIKEFVQKKYVNEEFPWESYFPVEPEEIIDYFQNPPYIEVDDLKFEKVDKNGLLEFLVEERGFSKENVVNGLKK